MDAKRKAMEGALVPAKRARNELVAVGDKENAIVQSVRVLYIEILWEGYSLKILKIHLKHHFACSLNEIF